MKPWITLARQVVFSRGGFLTVEDHQIQLPDGKVVAQWPWLVMPDYVNVVAQTVEGRFVCFRQTKYGVDGPSLAPVGGYIEPGEDPLAAARRELLEETGHCAPEWIPLGRYTVDGNRGAGAAYPFLARKALRVADPVGLDLEEQEMVLLDRSEISAALAGGEFKVLPWTTAVALALLHLDNADRP